MVLQAASEEVQASGETTGGCWPLAVAADVAAAVPEEEPVAAAVPDVEVPEEEPVAAAEPDVELEAEPDVEPAPVPKDEAASDGGKDGRSAPS